MVCSECFMYRSDPNDPKFGNRGLEQSKCPVCNNWSEIVCRSYHQMNSIEEKKEEIRKVVDIFDRKSCSSISIAMLPKSYYPKLVTLGQVKI